MSYSAAEQSQLRLVRAPVIQKPFRHIYVRDVFPQDCYAQMIKNLPPIEVYGDCAYPHRRLVDPAGLQGFWADLVKWMVDNAYLRPLVNKFADVLTERFGERAMDFYANIRLVRDDPKYSLMPHTDLPEKFLSFLFYLPADESMRIWGTTIMRHKDPDFTSDGKEKENPRDFEPVWTAPFMPNCCFAFPRTDKSFHAVLPSDCDQERNALLLNIYATPSC